AFTSLALPVVSVEVTKLADPLVSPTVPRIFFPCSKVTISPLGGAPLAEVTVAVKFTDWPYVEGFNEDLRVVVVAVKAALRTEVAARDTENTILKSFMEFRAS